MNREKCLRSSSILNLVGRLSMDKTTVLWCWLVCGIRKGVVKNDCVNCGIRVKFHRFHHHCFRRSIKGVGVKG